MSTRWSTEFDAAGRRVNPLRRGLLWLLPIEIAIAWVACVWLLHPHIFWSQNAIVLGLPVATVLVELEMLSARRRAQRGGRSMRSSRLLRMRLTAVIMAGIVFVLAGIGAFFDSAQDNSMQAARNDAGQAGRIVSVLNEALAGHDEPAFLSVATGSAVSQLTTWWNQLSALGVTGATVGFTDGNDQSAFYDSSSSNSWSFTMFAGLRTAFDAPGKYDTLPVGTYQAGFHQASADAPMRITSWKPLQQDPWDGSQPMHVVRQSDVLVDGEADEQGTVDALAPQAETAAAYVLGLYHRLDPKDVMQSGFVVLATSQTSRLSSWLGGGGSASALAGVGGAIDLPALTTNEYGTSKVSVYGPGFPSVSIALATPGPATSAAATTGPLVAAFTDAITGLHRTIDFSKNAAIWPVSGFGMFVESLYMTNPNPDPANNAYSTRWLTDQIKALPASYRSGALPTDAQLQPLDTGFYWAEVAASVYAYIATNYGLYETFDEVVLNVLGMGTPFDDVIAKRPVGASTGTVYLHDSAEIQNGWARWIAGL